MNNLFRFRIAFQTIKDYWKVTLIVSLLFMAMAAMYAGMYPAFKETLGEMAEMMKDIPIAGAEDMTSYVGFLNVELYQIFWILILAMLIGFIAASIVSKEIEAKTIDLFMSNPVSRKQIVFEKFVGLIPMMLIVNFATMVSVMSITLAVDEELNFGNLFMTHVVSIPYFLAVLSIGLLISVIFNEKMKASIIMIAVLVGMYILQSLSLMAPDYELMGLISITHYFDPYDILKFGDIDMAGVLVLISVTAVCLTIAMIYFEHRDIAVS